MLRRTSLQVAKARKQGLRVIGEPVASGLALDESMMWHSNFTVAAQYVMSPPIRSAEHAPALKRALAGGILQLVATDHAVFTSKQKEMGRGDFRKIPNGVNGIEERLHVVWEEMVRLSACSCRPSKPSHVHTNSQHAKMHVCIPPAQHAWVCCYM
jgi:dihydroorotase-like cyclic amidohydrolase